MHGRCLAVIPARGGSKGILRKNLQLVDGQPLVARAVRAALASAFIQEVVVSTDDPEIAQVATDAGAEVVERPPELSGDRASSEDALLHVLDQLEARGRVTVEILVFLQCTSPLTSPEDIDGTVDALHQAEADCAFTAAPAHMFLWRRSVDGDALGVNHDPKKRLPRQLLPGEYLETGAVYAMRVERFRAEKTRFCGKVVLHEVPAWRAAEVDDPHDLVVVRALAEWARRGEQQQRLPAHVAALVLDFDGVMTDDLVFTSQDGTEGVTCSRRDGMGVDRLHDMGIPVLVLSKEINPVVKARTDKLRIECIQGIDDKLTVLHDWTRGKGVEMAQVVYVGNDINDLTCLQAVGCGVVVADAHPDVLPAAKIVLTSPGGRGAVRELADMIYERQGVGSA